MDNQITLAGFEAPEYYEMKFISAIEPDLRAAIEDMGGPSEWLSIAPTNSYTVVKFGKLTAFRLKFRGGQHQIFLPIMLRDLIPFGISHRKVSEKEKYYQIPADEHPLDSYTDFLIRTVAETVNRYPKEWDCCSRYLECSDAKTCTHPDKAFALVCGYRKILSSGRIFFGVNRNI